MDCSILILHSIFISEIYKDIGVGIYYSCVYLATFIVFLLNYELHSLENIRSL